MKKWLFTLSLLLTIFFGGSLKAQALVTEELKTINLTQTRSQWKANVIDISSHQKAADIDFEKWKEQGIEAVVIKLTEGMEDGAPYYNPEAEEQISNALAAGLKVNFYHFSWMNSVENAIEEADWFTKIANQYNIPKESVMALDLENSVLTSDSFELTKQANAFFDRMIENGYPKIDVYASLSWFGNRFITEDLRTNNYWVASWSEKKPEIVTGMWQFTNNYRLEGYDGPLDGNIDFTGYYTQKVHESAAFVTVTHLDEEGNNLASSDILYGQVGEPFETSAKQLDGWTVKTSPENTQGFFSLDSQILSYVYERSDGKPVIVNYSDNSGNELASPTLLTGKLGIAFKTEAKIIPGWTVINNETTKHGLFTDTPETITFIYEKSEGAPITVTYSDKKGNELAYPDRLIGKIGDSFKADAKKINGWVLKSIPENAQGFFTEENQTVSFVYEPASDSSIMNNNQLPISKSEKKTELFNKDSNPKIVPVAYSNEHSKITISEQANNSYYPKTGELRLNWKTNGFFIILYSAILIIWRRIKIKHS